MSSSAFAYPRAPLGVPRNVRRQPRRRIHAPVPLHRVAVTETAAVSKKIGQVRRPPGYVIALSVVALLLHAAIAWQTFTGKDSAPAKKKSGVVLELVPPKPPEPKIEPPKPLPPKPRPVQQQAKVLPPIQTPTPAPTTDAAPSAEAPIAVPPVVTAPVEAEPVPEPVTPPFGAAGYLNNPPPEYPAAAARAGWSGVVRLRVHVLSNGSADTVEVQKSSGRKLLDDEAVRTVKNWTFTPSRRGDTPIDGWANVPIEFQL